MNATLNIIRDGSDLCFFFAGSIEGLEAFDGFGMNYGGVKGYVVRGKNAGLVACDWLMERGIEVVKK